MNFQIAKLLNESVGISMSSMTILSESKFETMNENILSKMFESVGQKYNEIDFTEIQKSGGSFRKFKYYNLLLSNVELLNNLYLNNPDPEVQAMKKYVDAINSVMMGLSLNEKKFVELYDNPIVGVIYDTSVASLIYTTTLLLSTTIRFITTDKDSDIEVIMDNIPSSDKKIFLPNILKLADAFKQDIPNLLNEMLKAKGKAISETYVVVLESNIYNEGVITVPLIILAIPAVAIAATKIIPIIRELIYGIYQIRVTMEQAIEVQIDLISANIEMLEDRSYRDNTQKKKYKKVIARQRKIVDKLDKVKRAISIKFDVAENQARRELISSNKEFVDEKTSSVRNDLLI